MTVRQPIANPKALVESVGGSPQPQLVADSKRHTVGGEDSNAQRRTESRISLGVGPPPTAVAEHPTGLSAGGDFTDLRIWAESFHDMQQARIAIANRMERGGIDADLLAGQKQLLDAAEHSFSLSMRRAYRRVIRQTMPEVETWQKFYFGIGEHLLARLIGHLGHPAHAEPYLWTDTAPEGHRCVPQRCGKRHLVALQPYERTLRQLWTYTGHGEVRKRSKGMSQEEAFGLGNPKVKMLVHLLAEGTIKVALPDEAPEAERRTAGSGPESMSDSQTDRQSVRDRFFYRRIYDARKVSTVDRGWTDGHRHADALRIVGKEILRDLWQASRAHRIFDVPAASGAGPAGSTT